MVTPREKVVLPVSVVTRRGEDAAGACAEPPAARSVRWRWVYIINGAPRAAQIKMPEPMNV